MSTITPADLTQAAAELGEAASRVSFMPPGVRAAVESAAKFCQAGAELIADLSERLQAEASTNAEILAQIGELSARLEAIEPKPAA